MIQVHYIYITFISNPNTTADLIGGTGPWPGVGDPRFIDRHYLKTHVLYSLAY